MIYICIFGYILVGMVLLTLISRLGGFTVKESEEIPPMILLIFWPCLVILGVAAGLIWSVRASFKGLNWSICRWVAKCQPALEEKRES